MSSDHGFWETLDLLIGREWKKPLKDDLVHDWVERVVAKRQMTKVVSEDNITQKESEKSSGYGSEAKKSEVNVPVEMKRKGAFVPPAVECTYVYISDTVCTRKIAQLG